MRHMVNINRQIMLEGMRADFHKVDRLSSKVIDIVRNAKEVRATTHGRQRLHRDAQPELQVAEDERPDQPRQVGQPARRRSVHHARRTSTARSSSTAWSAISCARSSAASRTTPLTLRVKDNRLVEAHQRQQGARETTSGSTRTPTRTRDRVGEFAIGTNIELKQVIGHILQDEKFPGIHIAFGNPYGAHTGADWNSSTHIDVVGDALRHLGRRSPDHGRRQVPDR